MSGAGNLSVEQSIQKWREPLRAFLRTQGPFVKSVNVLDDWLRFCPVFYPDRTRRAQIQILGLTLAQELPVWSHNSGRGQVYKNLHTQKTGIEVTA